MKTIKYLVLGLALAFVLTGCALSTSDDVTSNNYVNFG